MSYVADRNVVRVELTATALQPGHVSYDVNTAPYRSFCAWLHASHHHTS